MRFEIIRNYLFDDKCHLILVYTRIFFLLSFVLLNSKKFSRMIYTLNLTEIYIEQYYFCQGGNDTPRFRYSGTPNRTPVLQTILRSVSELYSSTRNRTPDRTETYFGREYSPRYGSEYRSIGILERRFPLDFCLEYKDERFSDFEK
jgi:hypothetical protein